MYGHREKFQSPAYEYALQFPNGKYYTGKTNSAKEPAAEQGEKQQAFLYTEHGAHHKRDTNPAFGACAVVRVL